MRKSPRTPQVVLKTSPTGSALERLNLTEISMGVRFKDHRSLSSLGIGLTLTVVDVRPIGFVRREVGPFLF